MAKTYHDFFTEALPLAEQAVARGEYPTVNPDTMARQVAHAAAGDMVRRGFTRMLDMKDPDTRSACICGLLFGKAA